MKRFISLLLTIMLLVSALTIPAISFADTNYGTITDFNKSISAKQYELLRYGTIKPIKKNNVWYYQFKQNGNVLLVKASAFDSLNNTCKVDDFKTVNAELTKGVANSKSSKQFEFIYKYSSVKQEKVRTFNPKSMTISKLANATMKKHTLSLVDITLYTGVSGDTVTMRSSIKRGLLRFEYSDMVNCSIFVGKNKGYKKPETESEYTKALKRTINDQLDRGIIPAFTLTVENGGKKDIILNQYEIKAETWKLKNNTTVKKVQQSIKVLKALKSIGKIKTPLDGVATLYDIGNEIFGFVEKENKFYNTRAYPLSCNGLFVKSAQFTSPYSLIKEDNYVETFVYLNEALSSSKNAKLSVKFSFSFE